MANKVKELKEGEFGIIIANGDETASQIALTEEQSVLFKGILSAMSMEKPLIKLSPEYDLVLKSSKYLVVTG